MTNPEEDLPDINDILELLGAAAVTVFAQDDALRYRWIRNPPGNWTAAAASGKSEIDVLPAKAAAMATAVKREVFSSGRAQWSELLVEDGDGTRYFDMFVAPDRDPSGKIVGVAGFAVDVSDRRAHAAMMESVAREQAHRTKNLLAVIQSLGTQTARSSASLEDFIDSFRGRIQSISLSQDLSIGGKRNGARLSDLIETQIHPYVSDVGRQFEFRGEDRYLSATAALHVGLAFYELCIAATQSGSLSGADGKATVTSTVVDNREDNRPSCLEVIWRERGGPGGAPIVGFAKVLLERIVPAAVGGKAAMSEDDDGRTYTLTLAGSEFE